MTRWQGWGPALAGLVLGACSLPESPGKSGRDAELRRLQGQTGVVVLDASRDRAVILARSREVVLEPPPDYCVDADSIVAQGQTVFVPISHCQGSDLPGGFPGFLTVSVSGAAAIGRSDTEIADYEALLTSPKGTSIIGRSAYTHGRVVETRRADDVIYVLVEELADPDAVLDPRFWRAFTGINGRLVLTTVSQFRDRAVGDAAMLDVLMRQIAMLRAANPHSEPTPAETTPSVSSVTASSPSAPMTALPPAPKPLRG